jgi:hypothetical protein
MGTSERRSYQMNISISRDLKSRMDEVRVPVNWSQTAAEAFEEKLLKIESRKDPKNFDDVIARMKAKAALEEKQEYEAGLEAGRIWAREDASPKELRRLEAAGHAENAERLAQTIWPEIGRQKFPVTSEDFWNKALGEDNVARADDADFLRGFEDGALEVWAHVKHSL